MPKTPRFSVKTLVHVSLLIAIEIVLSRFLSISTPIVKIGFSFLPLAVCGMLYGPIWAGAAGAVADLVGAILFPIGAYFPGFTLSAFLTGLVFGLFLHGSFAQRNGGWPAQCIAVAINCLGISLLLSTYWLTFLMDSSYWALLVPRILQNCIMIPIQVLLIHLVQRPVQAYAKRLAE